MCDGPLRVRLQQTADPRSAHVVTCHRGPTGSVEDAQTTAAVYLCGGCGCELLVGLWAWDLRNVVLRCASCGTLNTNEAAIAPGTETERPARITLAGVVLEFDDRWVTDNIRQRIYEGRYESGERLILEHTLVPGDRYLELGAGIGFITTCACRLIGADKVFAYEANPELAAFAADTARRNGFTPTVINAVLADAEGEIDFYVHEDFWSSTLLASQGGTPVRVPTRSFHDELARLQATYLMIDIEGGEVDLLDGERLPDCVRAVCLETHPAVVGAAAAQRTLNQLIEDGFMLDLAESGDGVAFLSRESSVA